jgi:hypothetical protein
VRLWAKIAGPWNTPGVGDEDCWYFGGRAKNRWGYPRFHWPELGPGPNVGAHIAAYVLTCGPVPAGQVVAHSCNHKMCCNPRHLSAATQSENIKQWWHSRRRAA